MMSNRPILFNGAMVRELMTCAKCGHVGPDFPCAKCGSVGFRKSQTRRVMKPQPRRDFTTAYVNHAFVKRGQPPYQPREVLWVREPGRVVDAEDTPGGCVKIKYLADGECRYFDFPDRFFGRQWVDEFHGIPNGIFKEAARLFLRVSDVRVQRLQDIRGEDARAEGVRPASGDCGIFTPPRDCFATVWHSIYSKRGFGWDTNPWIWAYTFERCAKPEGWPDAHQGAEVAA